MSYSSSGPPPPTDVTAVQDGPTSIRVTWTPPSPPGDTTGYRISFTGGSDVDIDDKTTNSYTLTGLTNGETYKITIVSVTPNTPTSSPADVEVTLGRKNLLLNNLYYNNYFPLPSVAVPEKPTIDQDNIVATANSISLSWTVPPDATESEVTWELSGQTRRRAVPQDNDMTSGRLPKDQNSYTISGLRSCTSYDITVTVFNPAGSSSTTFTHTTAEG